MFTVALAEYFHLPAAVFRVAGVHAQQVAGKDGGFIAAGAGTHFKVDVALVTRVLRQQQQGEILLVPGQQRFQVAHFLFTHFAHGRIAIGGELAGRGAL